MPRKKICEKSSQKNRRKTVKRSAKKSAPKMFPAIFFAAVDKRRGKVIFYLRRKIDPVKGGNMPLPIAPVGETLTVTKILADERNKRHLEDLGIAPGCTLQLLSVSGGSVILRIREGRLAIDRSLAGKILVG